MRESGELNFERQKQQFFTRLGLRARQWLKAHRDLGGLWAGPKNQRWENVSEHCLVEAARAEVFADLLRLSPEAKTKLFAGAIVHDFNKKDEILNTAKAGRTPESFEQAYAQATDKLTQAGLDPEIIEISDSVGHTTTEQMEKLVRHPELNDHEIACMIMHYIDDYTLGTEWVVPFDGEKNDLDRRMDSDDINPKYSKIAERGLYKERKRIGYLVEQRLSALIRERSGVDIPPKQLPEYIDQKIKERIEHEQ